MLTKWVGHKFHAEQRELIRHTFRRLGLSLAVDYSEDAELSIKDLSSRVVRIRNSQMVK